MFSKSREKITKAKTQGEPQQDAVIPDGTGYITESKENLSPPAIPEVSVSLTDLSSEYVETVSLGKKATTNLYALRKSLYTYSFQNHPFYNRVEVGINHIVIYPHPTQVGRRLLACMVATMWDERNYPYFNVYADLVEKGLENGVEFVLDHSGGKYSNPLFNSPYNSAAEHAHFHPQKSGTYHTHFYYGWQFSGLMAVHSVLALGTTFLAESESKKEFSLETVKCLDDFSHYIATILLGTLPFGELTEIKALQDLKLILDFILEKGLFNLKDSSDLLEKARTLTLSHGELHLIRKHYTVKDDDIGKILRTFVYDLNNFATNIQKMSAMDSKSLKLHQFGDKKSIEHLFKLACCLQNPENSIEFLDYQSLLVKAKRLQSEFTTLDVHQKKELEIIEAELEIRKLRKMAGLENNEELIRLRKEFAALLDTLPQQSKLNLKETDEEMIGFRSRVANRMHARGLYFYSSEVKEDVEQVSIVSRPNTHAALSQVHKSYTPTPRERIASEIFLKAVLHFTVEGIASGTIHSKFWELVYRAIVHHVSNEGLGLMTTHAVHGVLHPTALVNFSQMLPSVSSHIQHEVAHIEDSAIPCMEIKAHWYKANESVTPTSTNAKGSGQCGTLQMLEDMPEIDFQEVNAAAVSHKFLESFGVSLHPVSTDFKHTDDVTLFAAEYEHDSKYMKEYVLNKEGGGGFSVETHNYTHYFIPMDEKCQGGLILGRPVNNDLEKDKWQFISLKVPFGYLLKVNPGVIHSDSLCVGRYTTTLTAAKPVDSVLFVKPDGEIQPVMQHPAETKNQSITLNC